MSETYTHTYHSYLHSSERHNTKATDIVNEFEAVRFSGAKAKVQFQLILEALQGSSGDAGLFQDDTVLAYGSNNVLRGGNWV